MANLKDRFLAEAERYRLLEREAEVSTATPASPAYYRSRAAYYDKLAREVVEPPPQRAT